MRAGAVALAAVATLAAADDAAEAAAFLRKYMNPERPYSEALIDATVSRAIAARGRHAFAQTVPWPLFLNDVLPPSTLTEDRVDWRAAFDVDGLHQLVADATSLENAALRVSQQAWTALSSDKVVFQAAPPNQINNYDPEQTLNGTYTDGKPGGSCTPMALYLVACMRTLGIPARVAGVPHWNLPAADCPLGDASDNCGDHNWAEVWLGPEKGWAFTSPGEGLPFNQGWFFPDKISRQVPAAESRNHSVYASSFAPASEVAQTWKGSDVAAPWFPMVWRWNGREQWEDHSVGAWDVSARYTGRGAQEVVV